MSEMVGTPDQRNDTLSAIAAVSMKIAAQRGTLNFIRQNSRKTSINESTVQGRPFSPSFLAIVEGTISAGLWGWQAARLRTAALPTTVKPNSAALYVRYIDPQVLCRPRQLRNSPVFPRQPHWRAVA